jgi:hypothetical protein
VYVFAWLEADSSAPDLDIVLDCDRWMFAALSRSEMYRAFVTGNAVPQKTVGLSGLRALTTFVRGPELLGKVGAISTGADRGAPPRVMDVTYATNQGTPVEPTGDVIPEAVAGPAVDDPSDGVLRRQGSRAM